MSKAKAPRMDAFPGNERENFLRTHQFRTGKRCKDWFHSLQVPEAASLRSAGVHLMGQSLVYPPYINCRPNSPFDLLLFIQEGRLQLTLQSGISWMEAGEIWAIPADSLSRFELCGGRCKMAWMHLDRGTVAKSLHLEEAGKLDLASLRVARINLYLESLREEGLNPESRLICHKIYESLQLELERILHGERKGEASQSAVRVRQIWEAIEQNAGSDWKIPELARKSGLGPSRFHALCMEHMGMSPHDKLIQIRMNRAMRHLLTSDQKIEAIALESGYSDLSAFSKAFNKFFGMRPREFRENRKEDPKEMVS